MPTRAASVWIPGVDKISLLVLTPPHLHMDGWMARWTDQSEWHFPAQAEICEEELVYCDMS